MWGLGNNTVEKLMRTWAFLAGDRFSLRLNLRAEASESVFFMLQHRTKQCPTVRHVCQTDLQLVCASWRLRICLLHAATQDRAVSDCQTDLHMT